MIEIAIAAIICATVLAITYLGLQHHKNFTTHRADYEQAIQANAIELVNKRLEEAAAFRKDIEVVYENQKRLADELKLVKETAQIKTAMGRTRPAGSLL